MKKLLIILLTTASFSLSLANTNDRQKDDENFTAAEEDFIVACVEKEIECFAKENATCCIPEVVIIDQNDQILAKGDRDNPIIKNFIVVSDYLTKAQSTDYFRMNIITPSFGINHLASR